MSRGRDIPRRALRILALLAGFNILLPAAGSPGEKAASPPVTMEELEVRGVRENPDRLYVSVPRPIFDPAPHRFDLFAEELRRPVFPPGFGVESLPSGGTPDDGKAVD